MLRVCLLCCFMIAALGMEKTAHAPLPKLKHRIAVIAHRAGSALGPENTLAAIRNAIALKVDYVELDVRATRDGTLILLHDSKVDRTTDGKGAVAEMDFAQVRSLDAGSKFNAKYRGERIPTFEEALKLCKGRVNIYVDHKAGNVEQVLAAIRKQGMAKQVVIYNDPGDLAEWKRLAPEIPVMPSLPDEFRRAGGIAAFEKVLPAEVLDGGAQEWTKELVEEAHAAEVKVYVDSLGLWDTLEGFRKALAIGVDGIQTDHPDRLIELLKTATASGSST